MNKCGKCFTQESTGHFLEWSKKYGWVCRGYCKVRLNWNEDGITYSGYETLSFWDNDYIMYN